MRLESCHLIDAEKTFKGRDWYEIVDYFERQKQSEQASRTRQQQSSAAFHAQVNQIVAQATEQTEKASTVQSKRSRIQGIRGNRQLEREHERENGAWQLGTEEIHQQPGQVIPLPSVAQGEEDDEGYVALPKPIDKLRKLREKNWKNDQ
jgi:ATPase subunit of ABC transporter with duplicated ATPase domains